MKKLIISLLIFAMIIVSCACGTQKDADTAADMDAQQTSEETAAPDKSMGSENPSQDYSDVVGSWREAGTENVITVYENGGFMMDGTVGHYDGYLVYTEKEDGDNMWAPVPRYDMYLENNEPLEGASLTTDPEHPGQLVFVMGAGAQLFDREGELFIKSNDNAGVSYVNEYTYSIESDQPRSELIVYTDSSLTELAVLNLTFVDADDEGNVTFETEELYSLPTFGADDALILNVPLFGTIPNCGLSCVNEQGVKKYFAIEQSGMDGSILLTPFTPAE
ncbi:MAG: hypothetical protein II705_05410 [Clostridia bacterium]|nr:hypothetical protein [Clostridia bacterium]